MTQTVLQDLPEPTILDNSVLRPNTESEMKYKEKRKLELALQLLEKRKFNYEGNIGKIHSVLKGQSSDFIQEKMRAGAMFEAAQRDKDPIKLLKIIQNICYKKNRKTSNEVSPPSNQTSQQLDTT